MHVLLVERHPELQQSFAEALGAAGHSVAIGGEWTMALHSAREEEPALIVVDVSLEPSAAARFVAELHNDRVLCRVPVIALAYRFGSERSVLDAGVQCCIPRLPTPEDVVKAADWAAEVYCEATA